MPGQKLKTSHRRSSFITIKLILKLDGMCLVFWIICFQFLWLEDMVHNIELKIPWFNASRLFVMKKHNETEISMHNSKVTETIK